MWPRTMRRVVMEALAACAVGVILLVMAGRDIGLAIDMAGFVEGEATVTSVEAPTSRRVRLWRWEWWRPRVRYEFHVNGEHFNGSRYKLGAPTFASEAEAIGRVKQAGYLAGASVPVYYDPGDPSRSILSREVSFGWGAWTACVVLVGGGGLIWGGVRVGRLAVSRPYRERVRARLG